MACQNFKIRFQEIEKNMLRLSISLSQIRRTPCWPLKDRLCCISDQTKRSAVNLLYAQPTPLAICPGYIECVLYVCVHVCVAQGHVVKTPTVPASYLPLTVCQSFLLSNTGETHYTSAHTLSSEANMTKVDSLKLDDGPLKSSRGS